MGDTALESDSLSRILDNLLDLSRSQAGRLSLCEELVDMNKLVRETVKKIKVASPEHRIHISLPKNLSPVKADRLRAERILYNLLHNAVKYSPNESEVEAFAVQGERYLTLSTPNPFPKTMGTSSYRLKILTTGKPINSSVCWMNLTSRKGAR